MKNKLFNIIAALILSFCASIVNAQNEPYVELSSDGQTLTFKYGEKNNGDNIFDLNVEDVVELGGWHEDGIRENITTVVFHPSFAAARPTSCYKWFYEMINLNTISGMNENLNTSDVTDMESMFEGCSSLTTLDLSNFNTANVMIMHNMFRNCSNLTTIFVGSSWSTDYAVSTGGINMFEGCYSLVGGAGTAVNDLLSYFDIEYARIDGGPESITPGYLTYKGPYAELSSDGKTLTFKYGEKPNGAYDLNEGETTPAWSHDAENIIKVIFDESFKEARPTTCYSWFAGMENLTKIVGMKENLNTVSVKYMNKMFLNCSGLTTLDLSGFNTGNVENMDQMFNGCSKLTTILIDDNQWSTSQITSYSEQMFSGCNEIIGNDGTIFHSDDVGQLHANANDGDFCYLTKDNYKIFYKWSDPYMIQYQAHSPSTFSGSVDVTVTNPTREGAKFLYWTRVSAKDGTQIGESSSSLTIAAGDEGNRIYMMHWALPYAVISENSTGKTLTFKYDADKPETGAYDLNGEDNEPDWWIEQVNITKVIFDESFKDARPTSCYYWFEYMTNLTEIVGMKENLNTSEVTNMEKMFDYCEKLTTLDLSSFDTKKVENMKSMFYNCDNLTAILIGDNWNTENVTESNYMLGSCEELIGNDGTLGYDASYPYDKTYAHADAGGLLTKGNYKIFYDIEYDEDYYDIEFETFENSVNEFDGSTAITLVNPEKDGIPFGYWTRLKVYRMEESAASTTVTIAAGEVGNRIYKAHWIYPYAVLSEDKKTLTFYFDNEKDEKTGTKYDVKGNSPAWSYDAENIIKVIFDESFKDARPTSCYSWFEYMTNLTEIVGMKEYLNTSEVTNMEKMFYNCEKLTTLDLSSFDTKKVENMEEMFNYCENLTTILIGDNWDTENVTESNYMLCVCKELIGNDGTLGYDARYPYDKTYAHADAGGLLTKGKYKIFYDIEYDEDYYYNLEFETFENSVNEFDGSTAITLVNPEKDGIPFGYWTRLKVDGREESAASTTVTIAAGEVGNRIYKAHWIYPYAVLSEDKKTLTFYFDNEKNEKTGTKYDVKGNSPVWSSNAENITKVIFDESFKDARPTSCYRWFGGMTNLTEIVGMKEYFNTEKVTNMESMFLACEKLTVLDLSGFNTENVTNMAVMFMGCENLTTLDLSSFDTKKVENMSSMFGDCENLTAILIGDNWDTENVTESNYMLDDCRELIGNDGTLGYDASYPYDKTYAHANSGGLLTKDNYKIFFDGDAPDATMDNCATCTTNSNDYIYTEYSDDFTLPAMKRDHYIFKGWKRVLDNSGTLETEITETVSKNAGNRWFKAQWEELPKYSVVTPEGFTATPTEDYAGENITVTYSGSSQMGSIKLVPLPTTVTITPSNLDMLKDLTETLTAEIYPDLPEVNKAVKWTSSKPEVVSVTETSELQTTITTHAFGKALIKATTVKNNKSDSVWVICCALNPIYYVDPVNGDDDNDGVSEATAFKTFDAVLSSMINDAREYTVILKGEYTDEVTFDSYAAKSLTIRGLGSGTDYINTTVTTSDNSIIFENIKIKQLSGGAVLKDGAVTENVTTSSNLTVSGSAKAGNVTLQGDAKIIIAGALAAETVATITPSNYSNQVIELAEGVTDTKLAWERGRFMVTPSGSNYYYVTEKGKLSTEYDISEENNAEHPYILTTDTRRSTVFSPEVYIGTNLTTTTDKSYYVTLKDLKRESPIWNGNLNIENTNANTTYTVYFTLEGTNSIIGDGSGGMLVRANPGNVKLIFGTTTTGTLSLKDKMSGSYQVTDLQIRGALVGTLTFELAPGCTFSGTVGGTTYTDITEFFNAAQNHKGGSTMTITKN